MKTLQISEQSYFKGSIFGISKNRNKEQQYFSIVFFFALFCSFEKSTLRQSFCCFISLIMFLLFRFSIRFQGSLQLFGSSIIFLFCFSFFGGKLHLFSICSFSIAACYIFDREFGIAVPEVTILLFVFFDRGTRYSQNICTRLFIYNDCTFSRNTFLTASSYSGPRSYNVVVVCLFQQGLYILFLEYLHSVISKVDDNDCTFG